MKLNNLSVNILRVYDVGSEIDLTQVTQLLEGESEASFFRLRKNTRSIVVSDSPLVFSLQDWNQQFKEGSYPVKTRVKVWRHGVISITFKIVLHSPNVSPSLKDLIAKLDNNDELEKLFTEKITLLCERLRPVIVNFNLWDDYEPYICFQMDSVAEKNDLNDLSKNQDFLNLFLFHERHRPSLHEINMLQEAVLQYERDDLVMINWDRAVVIDSEDSQDICDVIEFALYQLLEMRFYDFNLDQKLNALYDSVNLKQSSILSNKYARLSRGAALLYLEVSDIVERVENTFKVTGDFYYAKIFRKAIDQFRLSDWQKSLNFRLNRLADISKLFESRINEKRNQFLEVIIIILIGIELIPFFLNLWKNF